MEGVEIKETFKNWICIGRVEDVREEGSYIARTILDEPIVVVNVGNDQLAAYFNVCRHHAAQICDEGQGSLDPVTKVREYAKKCLDAYFIVTEEYDVTMCFVHKSLAL